MGSWELLQDMMWQPSVTRFSYSLDNATSWFKNKTCHVIGGMIFQNYTFKPTANNKNCTFNSQGYELILMNINNEDVCGRAVPPGKVQGADTAVSWHQR